MTDSPKREANPVVVENKKSSEGVLESTQDRASLYKQYFVTQSTRTEKPAEFIQQVNGFGVQVFAQASSFNSR